ncbi:MAG: winged helix-turn-helix transcriptional regulator [Candidatus Pacearchaeota archaeon]|jgi:DNA-binding Lrp family transcriptional regulator
MKRKKRLIKDKARTIIEYIHKVKGYATANEIAEETGLSYLTVQKYLKELEDDKIILNVNKGSKQKKYSLNYDKILGEKR